MGASTTMEMRDPRHRASYCRRTFRLRSNGFDDQELKRLSEPVLADQQYRGGTQPIVEAKPATKARVDDIPVSLSTGKLNAIRAAFKAGLKPTQIARQFGISQSDVRKVLASDAKKR